jgi:WXG100 family type VII secretion target
MYRKEKVMPIFQADSDQLREIAQIFQEQADCIEDILRDLVLKTDNLRGYGWVGLGADAYYDLFDDRIKPSLESLIRFLEGSNTEAIKVAERVEEGEAHILSMTRVVR